VQGAVQHGDEGAYEASANMVNTLLLCYVMLLLLLNFIMGHRTQSQVRSAAADRVPRSIEYPTMHSVPGADLIVCTL
jgi:ABC-type uncharacterized transport system permease subunit